MGTNAVIEKIYGLSPMQESMLFHALYEKGSDAYYEQFSVKLCGSVDVKSFEKSLNEIIKRYDVFRTIFVYENVRKPQQIVLKERSTTVSYRDISCMSDSQKEKYIEGFKLKERQKGFDLSRDILIRLSVIKCGTDAYYLVLGFHHIILDGWCLGIVFKELFQLYDSYVNNKPLSLSKPSQFSGYIKWIEKRQMQDTLKYWADYLDGYECRAEIPRYSKQRYDNGYLHGEVKFRLDEGITRALEAVAIRSKASLSTLFHCIWGLLLQRYNNTGDVVFGTVVSGRPPEIDGIDRMIGLFINTIPVRIRCEGSESFVELLARVQEEAFLSEKNGFITLSEMQSTSILKQELLNHVIAFENYPMERELEDSSGSGSFFGLGVSDLQVFERTNYNFGVKVAPGSQMEIELIFNEFVYDSKFVKSIEGHIRRIAECLTENPDIPVKDIEILDRVEKDMLINAFNRTKEVSSKPEIIHALFEKQVELYPDNTAAVLGNSSMTYREINSRANCIARLLREKGALRNSFVGIMCGRSFELCAAVFGVLKSGGAYLPIDPGYPEDRISFMLDDSKVEILLVGDGAGRIPAHYSGIVINLKDEGMYTDNAPNLDCINKPDDLAYIIYTSGSTGTPKGVMIEHRGLLNFINWRINQYGLGPKDAVLQSMSFSFDGFGSNFYSSLLSGAAYVTPDDENWRDARHIAREVKDKRVTHTSIIPSMYMAVLENSRKGDMDSLRVVAVAAEKSTADMVRQSKKLCPQVLLVNEYGPTENSIATTAYTGMEPDTCTVIGKPFANNAVFILNKYNMPAPVGVPGELCVSGLGLAKGYLNNEALTSEKFVPNPYISGERMYRTGDLARWLPDGNIEYIGRIDCQVKIRGFRIEPGEVENRLIDLGSLKEAVVLPKEDKNGEKSLYAYIVSEKTVDVPELKACLAKSLPGYMIPPFIVQLESMPLLPNGKIDKKALAESEFQFEAGNNKAVLETETEQRLADIFKKVLNVSEIGSGSDFFELGGHSLKATLLSSMIHKELNVEIPLSEVLKLKTVKEIAAFIDSSAKSIYSSIQPVDEPFYRLESSAEDAVRAYKVSAAQRRLYFIDKFEGGSINYNMPAVMLLKGAVDKRRFEHAFKLLIKRHEALRTYFDMIEGEPLQVVKETAQFNIEYFQIAENKVDELIESFVRPFDLTKAPLFRVGLAAISHDKHIFMFDMHHIISDGISMGILIKEFASLYEGCELPGLMLQYRDYSHWQNSVFETGVIQKQQGFWAGIFEGEILVLNMPYDFQRPPVQSFEGDKLDFPIGGELTGRLEKIAAETGSTLFMLLLAAYNVLLMKYTGQEDIVVGSPVAGRNHSDLENIIGMFVNTLPLRNYPSRSKSFREFLLEVRENTLKAFENQDFQFEELVSKLNIQRDIGRNPLFDTMFVMQNMDIPDIEFSGLSIEPIEMEHKISKFDLTLGAEKVNEELRFYFEYCTKLFKRDSIERISVHFINLLSELAFNPDMLIGDIDFINEDEKSQILIDFNDTNALFPHEKTIHEIFEDQAAKSPNATALVYMENEMSYRELNLKANQLASVLREKGVGPDKLVGIMVYRSLEMVVGIMAVLKAGGAYLPIDPGYPQDRIAYMLEDAEVGILLTQSELMDQAKLMQRSVDIIDLENKNLYRGNGTNPGRISRPNHLAYMIYTSGSTGKPKGVMIEHTSVVNILTALQKKYPLSETDAYLLKTPYIFDVSVAELFGWFHAGGRLVILEPGVEKDPAGILKTIALNNVTHINFVPSMLSVFVNTLDASETTALSRLKYVFAAGEALPRELVEKFYTLTREVTFENIYGPTESTVYAIGYSLGDLKDRNNVPIGKPLANIRAYIVDRNNHLMPVGVPGELCLAGTGLARGYMKRPELNEEKFAADPFAPGERMYKTGDLAKWLPDGNIEFMGRIDQQVKIRGFRIELGEIESQLLSYPPVKETVVVDREDKDGNKYLCAYFVSDEHIAFSDFREHLSKYLPDYMVPAYFVQLDKLPLNLSGKIDRKALPAPQPAMPPEREYIAPRNEIEEKLATVWQEVLGVEKIGINHSFFMLGGDSIKAIQVLARLKKYNLTMDIKHLFQYPTIKEHSIYIKTNKKTIDQSVVEGQVELTPIQKWFFKTRNTDLHHFNHSLMLYNRNGFEEEALLKAFTKLIEYHDALRMVYKLEENSIAQYNRGLEGKLFDYKNINLCDKVQYEQIIEREATLMQGGIDLGKGPLVKLGLFRTVEGDHLLIVIHHLVVDGISWRVILEDLGKAYASAIKGEEIILQDKTESYRTWALKLKEYATGKYMQRELKYWKAIEVANPVLLPKDFQAPLYRHRDNSVKTISLDEVETEALLKKANYAYNTEINDILLTALGTAVKQWTGGDTVLVSLEGHGRENVGEDIDISRTVGWFTSIYPIVLDMSKSEDLGYQLKSVKETLKKIPNKGIGYGIFKYLAEDKPMEFKLKPEISFNYLGQFDQDIKAGAIDFSELSMGSPVSPDSEMQYSLDINGMVAEGRLSMSFSFNRNEFKEETIEKFISIYKEMLINIINHCVGKESTEMTPSDFSTKELEFEDMEDIFSILDEKLGGT